MKTPRGSLISHFSRLVTQSGGINLAQGKPDFAPPRELIDLLQQHAEHPPNHQYAPGQGNLDLLELMVERHRGQIPITRDNVLILQGATEGLFLTFFYLVGRLKERGSALFFDPPYESYPELADIMGFPRVSFDPGEDSTIDFDALARVVADQRVKIVFLASPGNPLGRIWNRRELSTLLDMAEDHDFHLIFDAVYREIYFDEPPADPLEIAREKGLFSRLFTIHSFSKMLSITGWRVGSVIAEQSHMERLRAIHDYTGLSAPSLFQIAIADYLKRHDFGADHCASVRRRCAANYRRMVPALERLDFDLPTIQGGYFLWARLPRPWTDGLRFADALYRRVGVGVVPGENFSPRKKDHIRLNMALDEQLIGQALVRFADFLETDPRS